MPIKIAASFAFETEQPTDVLLQFEAADTREQQVLAVETSLTPAEHCTRVPAQDCIGERIWIRTKGRFDVQYSATVNPCRLLPDITSLDQVQSHDVPGEVVQYLFNSRYIPADAFEPFVEGEFGGTRGGQRIVAMRDWIEQHFSYQPGVSDARTGALDTFVERRGICRDYAHVMVALARASTIPARYVSCYAPGVTPQDFHAVAEVFLEDPSRKSGGAWYIVDATGMAAPAVTAKIGVGRDAADVSFLTSFGPSEFLFSSVEVSEV